LVLRSDHISIRFRVAAKLDVVTHAVRINNFFNPFSLRVSATPLPRRLVAARVCQPEAQAGESKATLFVFPLFILFPLGGKDALEDIWIVSGEKKP
jgi:hypothetical protein